MCRFFVWSWWRQSEEAGLQYAGRHTVECERDALLAVTQNGDDHFGVIDGQIDLEGSRLAGDEVADAAFTKRRHPGRLRTLGVLADDPLALSVPAADAEVLADQARGRALASGTDALPHEWRHAGSCLARMRRTDRTRLAPAQAFHVVMVRLPPHRSTARHAQRCPQLLALEMRLPGYLRQLEIRCHPDPLIFDTDCITIKMIHATVSGRHVVYSSDVP